MIEKKIVKKGSEPLISRGGSTTKKTFLYVSSLREHVKKLAVLLRGGGSTLPPAAKKLKFFFLKIWSTYIHYVSTH